MEHNGSGSQKTKDYWTYLEDNYKEVATWPTWMRGEASSSLEKSKPKEHRRDEQQHRGVSS